MVHSLLEWLASYASTGPVAIEIVAAVLSCFGAYVVAKHGTTMHAKLGWIAWVASNTLWIGFALYNGHWGMSAMQTYFLYTASLGLVNTRKAIAS